MDGTLILSDMSRISFSRVIARRPWVLPGMLLKELTGKRAQWKRDLAERLVFDPAELDYHEAFLDWITVAERVAAHVGLFSDVMASDATYNLRDQRKAEALVARYGEKGFGYAGNSHLDMAVWERAGQVVVVNPDKGVLDKLGEDADIVFE